MPLRQAPADAVPETPADAPDSVNTGVLEIKVPAVGESITEVTLSRWIKKDGDSVNMDEAIAELESDKATFELTAEKAGILKTLAKEGDVLPIGAVVCTIAGCIPAATPEAATPAPVSAPVKTETPAANGKAETYASGVPSPAAAKILAEKGVNAAELSGSGVGGRITKEDAMLAQKISESPQAPKENGSVKPPVAAPAKKEIPAAGTRTDRREKMSSLRKTVAKRLVAVKNETAMLTTFNEVDMSPIMELSGKVQR